MDFFKKTREKLVQTVTNLTERGYNDADVAKHCKTLDSLEGLIKNLRTTISNYAEAMVAMGNASHKLADDITNFYRRSETRQKTINIFNNAQSDQESNTLFLFKEQLGWDVLHSLDQWLQEINVLRERARIVDNELHGKVPEVKNKAPLLKDITKMVENRFTRFDAVFVRLLELQKDFFADGMDVTEAYGPIITMYRKKVALPSSSGSVGSTTSAANTATTPETTTKPSSSPSPSPSPSPVSNTNVPVKPVQPPPPSSTPELDDVDDDVSSTPAPPSQTRPKPTSSSTTTTNTTTSTTTSSITPDLFGDFTSSSTTTTTTSPPPAASTAQANLFDFDFNSNSVTSPPPTSTPSISSNANNADLFGDLFGSSTTNNTSSTNSKPANTSTGTNNADFDLLGVFSSSSSSTATTTSTNINKPKPTTSSTADAFDPYLFTSSSSSTTTTTTTTSTSKPSTSSYYPSTSSGSGGVDDIDDDIASPSGTTTNNSTSNDFDIPMFSNSSTTNNSFDPLADDFLSPKSSPPPTMNTRPGTNDTVNTPIMPQGPQLSEEEEKNAITDIKLRLEPRIHAWRYRMGQERNIQGLLSTLDTVLWTGHTWKKVDTTQLLDYNQVKKSFRKALLTIHPDKVSGGTPEMKATADLVFEILNLSFKNYEISLGMRSA